MALHEVAVELFYSGDWHDHAATDEVYTGEADHGDDIKIRHGRKAESGGITPASATLVFRTWRFNPDNVIGDLYGLIGRNTPIRITIDGDIRFSGEVSSWTTRQSLGGEVQVPDRWVEVTCGGVLRRLEAGDETFQSSLRDFYLQHSAEPVAYWRLDSGDLARASLPDFGAGIFDAAAGARFSTADIASWLEPGVAITTGTVAAGRVSMDRNADHWAADHMQRGAERDFDFKVYGDAEHLSETVSEVRYDWTLAFDASAGQMTFEQDLITPATQSTVVHDTVDVDVFDGQPHHVRLELEQDVGGLDINFDISIDGESVSSGVVDDTTMQGITSVETTSPDGTGQATGFSHIAVWEGAPPTLSLTSDAAFGFAGEAAGVRFTALSAEAGVTATVAGTGADTVPMGPQFPGTLVAQYEEIEATDDGLIFDTVTELGVTYKTGRDRYNQEPALTLDYAAAEIAPPLRPVIDDKRIRNDVTVKRRDGDSSRAVDEASVDEIGRYTARDEVNVFSDLVVDDAASWRRHTGTIAGTRFEKVTVDLDATDLKTAVVATGIGDRIDLEHLPAELTPDTARLLAIGWTETIAPDRRKITFNCVPESAFHIGELEHAQFAIVGSGFSTTNEALDATETAVTIDCGGDGPWDHEVDFDIVIGGERMTVTAVGADSGTFPDQTQDLTVVRSVNGVVKTHATGVDVRLFHRAYRGL